MSKLALCKHLFDDSILNQIAIVIVISEDFSGVRTNDKYDANTCHTS